MLYPEPNVVDESIVVIAARAGRVALRTGFGVRVAVGAALRRVETVRPVRATVPGLSMVARALFVRDDTDIVLALRGERVRGVVVDVRLIIFWFFESLRTTVFCVAVRVTEFVRRSAVSP